jgi:quinol monooxygenase YgiN
MLITRLPAPPRFPTGAIGGIPGRGVLSWARRGGAVPTLPWTKVDDPPPNRDVFVLASRLELRSVRTVPGFLRAALAVRRQVRRSEGALGVSLIAHPARKTFFTLSAWADQAALDDFVRTRPHLDVMTKFPPQMRGSTFVTWTMPGDELPVGWDVAKERIAAAG